MAEKTVNYTPEMTAVMVEAYKANPTMETVEFLATKFSKTVKSVVAKLSREGVYQKKEYVNKKGEKPVDKENMATAIGNILSLSDGEMASLAKANKSVLNKIFEALANSKPIS